MFCACTQSGSPHNVVHFLVIVVMTVTTLSHIPHCEPPFSLSLLNLFSLYHKMLMHQVQHIDTAKHNTIAALICVRME